MPAALHLLTRADAPLAGGVIERQCREPDTAVTVVLLPGGAAPSLPATVTVRRVPQDLTYREVVDLIFASDHVLTW
jgi:hypothetical protein